ncbi:MAG: sterol desaturase family protein [Azospirillaceae bacterium]
MPGRKSSLLYWAISWLSWPVLLAVCLAITGWGFSLDQPVIYFNFAYFGLAVSLFLLERFMPHERLWLDYDGQLLSDIGHTLLSKGTVQGLFIFGGLIGLADFLEASEEARSGPWPHHWPMVLQIVLALIFAELFLYWAHRIAHEWYPLWRFHAIHHSVGRLWIFNAGRFHFFDSLVSILVGIMPLIMLGATAEIIQWLSAVTAFIGMLTHCNVDMRFGPLSWVFNTPALHRWHHSRDLREGNRNYGENIMMWDIVFRSYINPSHRPPVNIGTSDSIPANFFRQLTWPFVRAVRDGKVADPRS